MHAINGYKVDVQVPAFSLMSFFYVTHIYCLPMTNTEKDLYVDSTRPVQNNLCLDICFAVSLNLCIFHC